MTIYKPEKPKKYPTINVYYLNDLCWSFYKEKAKLFLLKKKYICYECGGNGKVKDRSQHDPVEGYKYADMIDCKTCNGSGIIPKNFIIKKYNELKKEYRKKLRRYNLDIVLYKSIKSKLNLKEWKYLNEN